MQTFDIYFRGEILPDADPATVKRKVAKLFKVADDSVDRLFTGKPLRVKQGIDADAASRYRVAFRDAGAQLQIVPSGDPPPARVDPVPADSEDASQPRRAEKAKVSDADISLAEPGATIDHTPPPPPAQIDTSALSAAPANTGSLEDCAVEKAPHPIPDISHMQIVDD